MLASVDLRWREVRDPFVVMVIVVPIKSVRTPVFLGLTTHYTFFADASAGICNNGKAYSRTTRGVDERGQQPAINTIVEYGSSWTIR